MASRAQIKANRANARKATGPRTKAGLATSSRNATKHGLTSPRITVLGLETQDEWNEHRRMVIENLSPVGYLEEIFADKIAQILWRSRRVAAFEAGQLIQDQQEELPQELLSGFSPGELQVLPVLVDAALAGLDEVLRIGTGDLVSREAVSGIISMLEHAPAPHFSMHSFQARRDLAALLDSEHRGPRPVSAVMEILKAASVKRTDSPDTLIANARRCMERLKSDLKKAKEKYDSGITAYRLSRLIPNEMGTGRIVRYEGHLERQLWKTLSELRALQDRRTASKPSRDS